MWNLILSQELTECMNAKIRAQHNGPNGTTDPAQLIATLETTLDFTRQDLAQRQCQWDAAGMSANGPYPLTVVTQRVILAAAQQINALLAAESSNVTTTTPESVTMTSVECWESGENAGRCGAGATLKNGVIPGCNPASEQYHCCSEWGYCGTGADYCTCDKCVDYKQLVG